MKIRKKRDNLPVIILGILILGLVFGIFGKQESLFAGAATEESVNETASEDHIITIYDNGSVTNIRSNAKTVKEVVERAGIVLGEDDAVEPKLDEEINEDNFYINIYRAHEALVIDGSKSMLIRTASSDAEQIAKDAGVELREKDSVEAVTYNNFLETGMRTAYKVIRAKTINLDFYGKPVVVRSQANTIAEFLKEQGIDMSAEENWVSLPTNTEITDNINLVVARQGKQTINVEEDIQFATQETADYGLEYGKTEIITPGQNGKKTVTYEVEMLNGQIVNRRSISEIITKQPVTQQIKRGMKVNLPEGTHQDWMARAGISAADYGYVNFIVDHESHWNPLAKNRSSGATGLCQALPGNKMASAGADWATNPITQLRWCNSYAVGRYGSWQNAYNFWQSHKWW